MSNPEPGYFESLQILKALKRFQHLIRHDQRWAHQIDFAPPLEELIPDVAQNSAKSPMLVEREINRLIPSVSAALRYAKIPTRISWKSTGDQHDLIQDYFYLPRDARAQSFDSVLHVTDQGIGYFERRVSKARRELISPVHWGAYLLGLPLRVLELSGIKTSGKVLGDVYAWAIKLAVFLLLALLATKLGVSIPWTDLPVPR
ncbi:hypothetical protein N9166_00085 [bacterium]|nr:hypothetical protein [bacterium]MDB4433119.1 hypothetical protein [bacterium]